MLNLKYGLLNYLAYTVHLGCLIACLLLVLEGGLKPYLSPNYTENLDLKGFAGSICYENSMKADDTTDHLDVRFVRRHRGYSISSESLILRSNSYIVLTYIVILVITYIPESSRL